MPLSKPLLDAVQKGGSALHVANALVQTDMQRLNQALMSALAQAPSGSQIEAIIKDLKSLAGVYHQLQQVDELLRQVYGSVQSLQSPQLEVLQALEHHPRTHASATQVQDVEPTARKKRAGTSGKAKAKPGRKPRASDAEGMLMSYLRRALRVEEWTRLSQEEMAKGAGISAGSVNTHLQHFVSTGLVQSEGRGKYKLTAASTAQS